MVGAQEEVELVHARTLHHSQFDFDVRSPTSQTRSPAVWLDMRLRD